MEKGRRLQVGNGCEVRHVPSWLRCPNLAGPLFLEQAPIAVLTLPVRIHTPRHSPAPGTRHLPEASSVQSPLTCVHRAGARGLMAPLPLPQQQTVSGVSAEPGPSSLPSAGKTASRRSPSRLSQLPTALTSWVTCLHCLPPLPCLSSLMFPGVRSPHLCEGSTTKTIGCPSVQGPQTELRTQQAQSGPGRM